LAIYTAVLPNSTKNNLQTIYHSCFVKTVLFINIKAYCTIYGSAKLSENNVFVFPNCLYTGTVLYIPHFWPKFAAFYCAKKWLICFFFQTWPHFSHFLEHISNVSTYMLLWPKKVEGWSETFLSVKHFFNSSELNVLFTG